MTEPSLFDLAEDARRAHNYHAARAYLVEAVSLLRKTGNAVDIAHSLTRLGQIERDLGRPNMAEPLYAEAIDLYRGQQDASPLASAVRHLGDIYRDLNNLDEAEPHYFEALAIYRGMSEPVPLDIANVLRPIALLLELQGRPTDAKPYWQDALNLYASVGIWAGVDECRLHLA